MIKVGIVGVSGYGGIELFHILHSHPEVKIEAISSRTYDGLNIGEVYPHLSHLNFICRDYSPDEMAKNCDLVFTSVPHGGPAMEYAEPIKKEGKKLIDLSADFRISDVNVYEKYYKTKHLFPELLKEAVYGLPEIHRNEIKNAWLIANPGCYPTGIILSLAPLFKEKIIDESSIIIDSKSGVSGAGRTPKQNLHYPELDEGFQAYAVNSHRHASEIDQELSLLADKKVSVIFVPHLAPMIRGILSVVYVKVKKDIELKKVVEIFKKFYNNQVFIRILEKNLPNTKYVSGTNFVDLSITLTEDKKTLIIISAIDNLIKGASGQAVQNMNIAYGLEEGLGLNLKPCYP